MSAENLCAGCTACCRGMFLNVSKEERENCFPEIQEVDVNFHDKYEVYYTSLSQTRDLVYTGQGCPNLVKTGNCKIYENRPEACRNFELDGPTCNKLRSKFRPTK